MDSKSIVSKVAGGALIFSAATLGTWLTSPAKEGQTPSATSPAPAAVVIPTAATPLSPQEIVAKAPSLQILLDNSGNSPATNRELMRTVAPLIVEILKTMPLGTAVIVNTIGDAKLDPLVWRTRIQKRVSQAGAPMQDIATGLQQMLIGFPERISGQIQGESHLVGGFADAARNINPNSDKNKIVAVTDLIENSDLATDCYSGKNCKLPSGKEINLAGTEVTVYGAGAGLPSKRAMALIKSWEIFFKGTRAARFELHRF